MQLRRTCTERHTECHTDRMECPAECHTQNAIRNAIRTAIHANEGLKSCQLVCIQNAIRIPDRMPYTKNAIHENAIRMAFFSSLYGIRMAFFAYGILSVWHSLGIGPSKYLERIVECCWGMAFQFANLFVNTFPACTPAHSKNTEHFQRSAFAAFLLHMWPPVLPFQDFREEKWKPVKLYGIIWQVRQVCRLSSAMACRVRV